MSKKLDKRFVFVVDHTYLSTLTYRFLHLDTEEWRGVGSRRKNSCGQSKDEVSYTGRRRRREGSWTRGLETFRRREKRTESSHSGQDGGVRTGERYYGRRQMDGETVQREKLKQCQE